MSLSVFVRGRKKECCRNRENIERKKIRRRSKEINFKKKGGKRTRIKTIKAIKQRQTEIDTNSLRERERESAVFYKPCIISHNFFQAHF